MIRIKVGQDLLKANDRIARSNRELLRSRGILCLNLISSPGAGKTSLLEVTCRRLGPGVRMAVIEGDLATDRDAARLERFGIPVVQINTGTACHLDASMVSAALEELPLGEIDLLAIENVGNLICPAGWDLGESYRVMMLSVPEGHDKLAKYPLVVRKADLLVVNKTDLAEACDFDWDVLARDLEALNPALEWIRMSCRTEEGVDEWIAWLRARMDVSAR